MNTLHYLLIAAGIVLVIVVIAYNRLVEARWKRKTGRAAARRTVAPEARSAERIEPTLVSMHDGASVTSDAGDDAPPVLTLPVPDPDDAPLPRTADRPATPTAPTFAPARSAPATSAPATSAAPAPPADTGPDREIECIVSLEPVQPVAAGALAAGLHARVGKRLRWFGRTNGASAWEQLASDSSGRYAEVVACMLLADRNGAASAAQLEAFARLVGELAPALPAAFVPPDLAREAQRAEALDRLCAELDVQIGLTVQKQDPETIQGTRLRGVAEASGFRLAPAGRFEYAHEDTGAVLYTMQNLRQEPFTADSLRLTATPGAVLVLDVARVADPPRAFDHMKISAKRLATTLGAALVDDNRRVLDDAAFAKVREEVVVASDALAAVHIEPGSARALALFGA